MTFCAVLFDLEIGQVAYANAGHNMPYVFAKDADDARFRAKRERFAHHRLVARGTPLGMEESPTYEVTTMPLRAGDRFILYTDGIFECTNDGGTQWGERAFRRALDAHLGVPLGQLPMRVLEAAFSHFGDHPIEDDITFVAVDIGADWAAGKTAREAA
jgi:serine phosphatase RsbU (regulator of sigma subunit)